MKSLVTTALAGAALVLAGCAQQEEPAPVRPEPMFDKFGGGTCTEGYVYVPGTIPELAECIPDDDCEPVYDTSGAIIDCPPPPRGVPRDAGSDSSSTGTTGRDPTGAPGTAPAG